MKEWLFCLLLITTMQTVAKPTLTVYTYGSFSSELGPGPIIKKEFEKQCNCELKFITLKDNVALLNRLQLEGRKSQADIVLGLDNNLTQTIDPNLFAPHNIDATILTLPNGWHDKTFLPYNYGYLSFIYDRTKLKNPPSSMHQLINSNKSIKIIYEDPRTSTPGFGLLLWIQKIYGSGAQTAWKKLASKTVTVTKSWSQAYGLFLKGEADMVLSYTTSPAYHFIEEKKQQYATAVFSEGHYQQIEVAAQLKTSKQPAIAQQFIQFILSSDFQNTIPTGSWMYPVIKVTMPIGFSQLPQQISNFTPQQIAARRVEWIKNWQQAVS